jgi:transglutaminase-like putative cysteine protease
MTAEWTRQGPVPDERPEDQDLDYVERPALVRLVSRLSPEEGWLSVPLVLVMAGTMAWSIADARWILGRDDLTSFVIPVALAAALWGFVSARLGMAPWVAHFLGAVIGALVVIELVGMLLPLQAGDQPGIVGWFNATANSVAQAYLDLTWRHQISTYQYGHFCLVIGIFVWATAQAASYDVFGYHRTVNGVVLLAVILLANMALTLQDHFWALVVFSSAGLWLLVRSHAADVRSSWLRHRIWRGADIDANTSRGGLGFASLTICGALLLTTVASSAPLQSFWPGLGDNVHNFASWISTYLPNGGRTRIEGGADFGSSKQITLSFQSSSGVVLTIRMPQGTDNSHWRVIAYDLFRSTGWDVSPGPSTYLPPESGLTAGTLDQIDKKAETRTSFSYTVVIKDTSIKHLVVASEPGSASTGVTRVVAGDNPKDGDVVWYPTDSTSYTVTSYLPNMASNGLTEWRLRQDTGDYSLVLKTRYTQGAGLVGAPGQALLARIESWAAGNGVAMDPRTGHFTNAFDAAKSIQDYLRNPANFTYNTNVSDLGPLCSAKGLTTVDCFATYKKGFCEQYATTMTMLMRAEGFSARYVEGFLSGTLDEHTNTTSITGQQRHAWVEVFFPSYGWIPFDPTGGPVGQPTELPAGSPAPGTPRPTAATAAPADSGQDVLHPRPGGGATGTPSAGDGGGLSLLIPIGGAGLVALLAVAILFMRRPRRPETPEIVYRGIVRLASRLGYKPLPTQTVYEYTGMLARIVPGARAPLEVVANAQVEVVYGRRQLPAERLAGLAGAQRVVRQSLLRMVFSVPRFGRDRRPDGRKVRRR